jgi:hypothetical protein
MIHAIPFPRGALNNGSNIIAVSGLLALRQNADRPQYIGIGGGFFLGKRVSGREAIGIDQQGAGGITKNGNAFKGLQLAESGIQGITPFTVFKSKNVNRLFRLPSLRYK